MTTLKSRLIAFIPAIAAICLQAKDLKTEITVDRTIVPVEREAYRLGSLNPRLLASPTTFRSLSLTEYTTPSALSRSIPRLEPAAYADTFALSPYRGYASIGYFPAFNIGASAGYRFIDTRRTRLGAWLQYDGYSYKPSDAETSDGSYSDNTVTIGAWFDQRVGSRSQFGAGLSYSHAAVGLPDEFVNDSRSADVFDGRLTWTSRVGVVGYGASLDFSHFGFGKDMAVSTGSIKAASENRFTLKGGVGYYGSSESSRGGIDLTADFVSRSNGFEQVAVPAASLDFDSYDNGFFEHDAVPNGVLYFYSPIDAGMLGVISLTPYYSFSDGTVNGRIGAKVELSTGGDGKKIHVAPDVMLDWNPASQLALFARIGGGEHLNSLRTLFDYCPFMNSAWQYQRSHLPVTADLGVNIGSFAGFSARIFGGYAVANEWLMPQYSSLPANSQVLKLEGSNFGIYDIKGWHAGVGLAYELRSMVKAEVSAQTAPQGRDKGYYMWLDRAKYVIDAKVEVRPIAPLRVSLGYQLRTKRRNYAFDGSAYELIDLRSVNDLSVDASYSINDSFSVFARGENLLNRRHELISDIESQGIKGLIGINYKF